MYRFLLTPYGKNRRYVRSMMAVLVGLWLLRASAVRLSLTWGSKGSSRPHKRIQRKRTLDLVNDADEQDAWELYLFQKGVPSDGAIHKHLGQLLGRQDVDDEMRRVFRVLAESGAVQLQARNVAERLSVAIQGQVRVLLESSGHVNLVPPTPKADSGRLLDCFDEAFPSERPLDCNNFPSFAKLLIVRRIFKTLASCFGDDVYSERSCPVPLVIDVSVDLGQDEPFRIHTVTPFSHHASCALSLIEEVDTPPPTPANGLNGPSTLCLFKVPSLQAIQEDDSPGKVSRCFPASAQEDEA
eukprot:gnl/TRDRNA2_/TRDRNA2_67522_c0_seq1.p1 gnl/TRDRNA2_/TRDRNA2_67522_c0~~gnl/TRDRNA2_/TRDRNA2_67522_c0_seq1.p1  ORF type:complete len:298 (-),score=34.22 gnl/TRDRNA2_/TRDRNA2_67522_c0_seq1:186-1079(-)